MLIWFAGMTIWKSIWKSAIGSKSSPSARSVPSRRLLWTAIEWKVETLAALNVDIEQARETLAHLEETTWRVRLREIDGERYVVLPAGTLSNPLWTVGGRPALKLSSE